MDLYKRQQFEFLLQTAVERLVERLEQRLRGADAALVALQQNQCEDEIKQFVEAIFADFLLDNLEGACFVLQSFAKRPLGELKLPAEQTIQATLIHLAKQHFQTLLRVKTLEALEPHSGYQPVDMGAH